MDTTDAITQGLIDIARKYGVDTEYDSENVFQFKGVQAGMGTIISDDVGMLLLKHRQNSSIGYSPTSQILRVAWEDDNEED